MKVVDVVMGKLAEPGSKWPGEIQRANAQMKSASWRRGYDGKECEFERCVACWRWMEMKNFFWDWWKSGARSVQIASRQAR
jgi:hypothetical protein